MEHVTRGRPVAAYGGRFAPHVALPVDPVYFDSLVRGPVVPLGGNRGPLYPPELREQDVEGIVLAQYIVEATG